MGVYYEFKKHPGCKRKQSTTVFNIKIMQLFYCCFILILKTFVDCFVYDELFVNNIENDEELNDI